LVLRGLLCIFLIITGASSGQLLNQANQLYSNGKLYDAIKAYRKAAVSGESPALCYFNAANAYYQLDSLAQAVVCYRSCIAAAPQYINGYLNLAVVYHSLNDLGPCISTAHRLMKLDPENQKGRLLLACAYRETGSLAESIIEFEKLTATYPSMDEPYVALGEIYRDLNDFEMARKWLTSYPANGKHAVYVYTILADLSEQQGDQTQALFYLQKVFSLDTTANSVLYRIVNIQVELGNDLVAYETVREASERFPRFADIALLGGNIAFTHGWIEEAEQWYTKAQKLGSAQGVIGLQNVRAIRLQRAEQINKQEK
jgi:tetratricopeptide (TPR) repeat protein